MKALVLESLLDESAAFFAPDRVVELGLPDDELHNDILLPLLPAMIADKAIREHWNTRTTGGFAARLNSFPDDGPAAPRWDAADFEIHVTASYQAAPDARALADTLLSEESLRELAAAIMNIVTEKIWSRSKEIASNDVPDLRRSVDSVTTFCILINGRRPRRSIVRTAAEGTFIVRRLLSRHWTAQKNRTF